MPSPRPLFCIRVEVTKLTPGRVISSSLKIYYCDEITRLVKKNLKFLRDQTMRTPINELSILKKFKYKTKLCTRHQNRFFVIFLAFLSFISSPPLVRPEPLEIPKFCKATSPGAELSWKFDGWHIFLFWLLIVEINKLFWTLQIFISSPAVT